MSHEAILLQLLHGSSCEADTGFMKKGDGMAWHVTSRRTSGLLHPQ